MKTILELTNREEVIREIADNIGRLDVVHAPYEVDLYLYVDQAGHGTISEFTNPGGNSWLDDDHYLIYRSKAYYDSLADLYESADELCESISLDKREIAKEIAEYHGWSIDCVEDDDIRRWLWDYYADEIRADYSYWRDDSWYVEAAKAALEEAEENERRLNEME